MFTAEITILFLVLVNFAWSLLRCLLQSYFNILFFLLMRLYISLFRAYQHQLFVGNSMLAMIRVKSSKDLFKWINRMQVQCRNHKSLLGHQSLSSSQKLQSAQDLGRTSGHPLLAQLKLAGTKPKVLNNCRDSQVLNASPMIQEELEKLQPQDEGSSILFRCCACQKFKDGMVWLNLLSKLLSWLWSTTIQWMLEKGTYQTPAVTLVELLCK